MDGLRKWLLGMLLILWTGLVAAGCGTDVQPPKKAPASQGAEKIVIGLMPDIDSLPFVIAQEKGFFKDEGVEVRLLPFKSAMERDAALQSGNLDGAVSDLLAAAFAKSGGFDVKVTSATDGMYRLLAGPGETAADVAALAGKEVAVSKNTIIEYVTDQILHANHMAENSVKKIVIPQIPTRLELLQQGKLSAATLPEPLASVAVHHGCRYLVGSNDLGIHPGVMLFTKNAVDTKREQVRAVYRAYNKAVRYLKETPRAAYIDIAVEKSGFPPVAKETLVLPAYHEARLPEERDVAACIAWLKEKRLIEATYTYQDIVAKDCLP